MINFTNINNEKESFLYTYKNGILIKICPECKKEIFDFENEMCCYCGQRFITLNNIKKEEKNEMNSIRYVIYSKDKTKILTYRGFVDSNRINSGNPKLFPTLSAAKQELLAKYPEDMLNDCIFIKTKIFYEEIK